VPQVWDVCAPREAEYMRRGGHALCARYPHRNPLEHVDYISSAEFDMSGKHSAKRTM
jgi:hypothetical protein